MKIPRAKHSKKSKLALLIVASICAVCAYFAAYAHYSKSLTQWQAEQPIDFTQKTGTTKLKAQLDSLSVAGITFVVVSASAIIVARILFLRKIRK